MFLTRDLKESKQEKPEEPVVEEEEDEKKKTKIDEKVMVKVVNPGILEVPKGTKVWDLPEGHFKKLVKKRGQKAVMLALLNLERWNKGKEGRNHIATWARSMIDKLKLKKG